MRAVACTHGDAKGCVRAVSTALNIGIGPQPYLARQRTRWQRRQQQSRRFVTSWPRPGHDSCRHSGVLRTDTCTRCRARRILGIPGVARAGVTEHGWLARARAQGARGRHDRRVRCGSRGSLARQLGAEQQLVAVLREFFCARQAFMFGRHIYKM